ncbi:MAG TPA: ABC transporter substrate-binding protein [Gaiellaceae bacterium]|nr:ABC transporter substrate-binding protein [Gaiellaceae bacterium]
MSRRTRTSVSVTAIVAFAAVAMIALAAALARPTGAAGPKPGGTYRVAFEQAFGFSDGFDPTGEYYIYSFDIYANLMIRTLVGYNHVAGPAGNALVPDIATAVPKPTNGGKTYTFHLKRGIKFGPPVNREVTSRDILYAMERIAHPKDGAQYGFYYSPIVGFDAYGAGKAKTIAGIKTPNAHTIVFDLTRPTGDFLYRMSLPATGPIPREVARCFEGQAGRYGKDVVSTGPYMIQGADKVDDSSCAKLKPMSGFDAISNLTLVRNPDYDPKTDSPAARQNFPDEFQFTIDANSSDIIDRVEAGELEDENGPSVPPQALEEYSSSSKRQYLHLNPADGVSYLSMNLTQPPFDDVHVRRAMNWIMDKTSLRQVWGGPDLGQIANHIVPDSIFDDELSKFAPYKTPGDAGSLEKAKAAMKGSKYDVDGNGTCGAPACKNVLLLTDTQSTYQRMVPIIQADAAKIGITFHVATVNGAYPTIETTSKNIPIAIFPGWFKDYADALTFFAPLFDGRTIIAQGNTNYSLVGMKPSQAKALGVTGSVTGVPSVDGRLDRCAALAGQPRLTCYEDIDRTLMTKVVPWVPYLAPNNVHIVGSDVTQWNFDQFSGNTAYAHVAVR